MKVLLVDDSKTTRTIEKGVLAKMGYMQVVEAVDGLDAMSKAIAEKPELILLDWNMPNMDGLDFIKAFRKQDTLTPVIMVTTESGKSRVLEAIKEGVNNYVVKPFTPDTLQKRVNDTLASMQEVAAV